MDWARLLRIRREARDPREARPGRGEGDILVDASGREPLLLTDFVEPERPSAAAR